MDKQETKNNVKIIDLRNLSLEYIIRLNEISVCLVEDFNQLSEKIFQVTNKNISWLFSSVLSRNPNQSNLFLYCCYLVLINEIISENKSIDKIIVPSNGFKKVLSKYIISKSINVSIKVSSNRNINRKLKDLIWTYFGIIISFYTCWKLNITKNKRRKRKISIASKVKLIDTYIYANSLRKGKYIDRNYTGILDFLSVDEREFVFFVPHILGEFKKSELDKIHKSSKENIIFKQDFLKFQDYIAALTSIVKMGKIKYHSILLREFNISPIVSEEISLKKYGILSGLLNFHFFKRLKNEKIDLNLVINWFENQPLDKGFNLGVKTYYPNVIHIGYKGYIGEYEFNIYNNPIKFEVDKKLIPNILGVTGEGCEKISKKYYKEQIVKVFPAFRHNDLWHIQRDYKETINKKVILVALPLSFNESVEILILLLKVVNKNNFGAIFHIKPHPALNLEAVKKVIKDAWHDNFLVVSGDFIPNVIDANIVLGTGTTSCVESIETSQICVRCIISSASRRSSSK